MKNIKRYSLGKNGYKQKPVCNDLINATDKIKKYLQEQENKKYGRKAQEVTFAYTTKYIYDNFLRGKNIK